MVTQRKNGNRITCNEIAPTGQTQLAPHQPGALIPADAVTNPLELFEQVNQSPLTVATAHAIVQANGGVTVERRTIYRLITKTDEE